jgi:hypothetical protein
MEASFGGDAAPVPIYAPVATFPTMVPFGAPPQPDLDRRSFFDRKMADRNIAERRQRKGI